MSLSKQGRRNAALSDIWLLGRNKLLFRGSEREEPSDPPSPGKDAMEMHRTLIEIASVLLVAAYMAAYLLNPLPW